MSTHNLCFREEIRKIFTGYPPLSRPMLCNHSEHSSRREQRVANEVSSTVENMINEK